MIRDLTIYPRTKNTHLVEERLKSLNELSRKHAKPGSPEEKAIKELANSRRKALRLVERSIRSNSETRLSLFLSHSGLGRRLADRAKEMALEYGFQVKTGFDVEVEIGASEDEGRAISLPQAIISQIISSTCFLGIWTDDFVEAYNKPGVDGRGNAIEKSQGSIPSVWLPFELGIAASHELPFRMLVIEGMHRLYYEKPFDFTNQIVFRTDNYDQKLTTVMEYFDRRMRDRVRVGR